MRARVRALERRRRSERQRRSPGNLIPEPVAPADGLRIAELVARYRDLPLGTADASVITAAERLVITDIATMDRRQYTVVQPVTGSFRLLP
jgi:predicted nucleic acid-binding protein